MKIEWMFVMVVELAACRPEGSDATMEDAAQAEGDDPDSDAWNCGELGLKCVGALGIGECVEGVCGPSLEPICTGTMTCEQLCGSVDKACAERGCEGATAFRFTGDSQAEADARCLDGVKSEATPLEITCAEQPGEAGTTWICCCD